MKRLLYGCTDVLLLAAVAVALLGVDTVIALGDALARRRRAAQALLRARLPYRRSAPAWLRSANPQSAFRNPQCR